MQRELLWFKLLLYQAAMTTIQESQCFESISFMVFAISDAIALVTSSTSILMFLSILTSRYAENDFLESLPFKLMIGLTTLFISITTMMVAFGATFFIVFDHYTVWVPIAVALFACVPIILFATLQYPLLADVIHSTYGSSFAPVQRERENLMNFQDGENEICVMALRQSRCSDSDADADAHAHIPS
ncbi:hypothetical protein ACSBR2_012531 [Camellia fascicularis]